MPLEREIDTTCKRCDGTGIAITLIKHGRPRTWVCTCSAGRSIAPSIRPAVQDRLRHG